MALNRAVEINHGRGYWVLRCSATRLTQPRRLRASPLQQDQNHRASGSGLPALLGNKASSSQHEGHEGNPKTTIADRSVSVAGALRDAGAVFAVTGLRIGEAIGIKWSDFDGDMLHICRRATDKSIRPRPKGPIATSLFRKRYYPE